MAKGRVLAYHNLSFMLEAGMPILKSLNTIALGQKGTLKDVFSDLAEAVSKGNPLAESMAKHPAVFTPIDVMMIEAAETSGNRPSSFKMLSDWHEFCGHFKATILSGLLLPIVLIGIAAFVGPLPALFLGNSGFTGYISEVIAILALFYLPAAIVFAVFYLSRSNVPLRRSLDTFVLRIPLLGKALRQLAISRYCRAFNMLFKAGVPITQCAQKAAGATGNTVIGDLFKGGSESARSGNMVSDGFSPQLPTEFLELWQVAEQTGELDRIIQKLADTSGESAEFLFNQIAQWLPRLVYAMVCIVIIIQIFRNAGMIMVR